MSDLISKAAVKEMFDNGKITIDEDVLNCDSIHEQLVYLLNKIEEFIDKKVDEIPVVDAVPVVHGEWEVVHGVLTPGGDPLLRCPICRSRESEHLGGIEFPVNWNYCPVCGADMRKKEKDDGRN